MATAIPQKLYTTTVNGIPSLQMMSDITMDPNASYLGSQFQEVKSADQLAGLVRNMYSQGTYNLANAQNMLNQGIDYSGGTSGVYSKYNPQARQSAFSTYQSLGNLTPDMITGANVFDYAEKLGYNIGADASYFSTPNKPSAYSTLTPEEQKSMGFDSPFVATSSIAQSQQYQADIASGKLVPIPGQTFANGEQAYAPAGSAAVGTPSQDWLTQNKLLIPATIPSSVLGSTATKGSVMQQAQAQQPKTIPTISSLMSTVKPGEQSANVASLQNALISAGYSIPAIQNGTAKPGFYGDQTAAALKKYQADQALIANGGKQVDTSLSGIKKSLNDTLTALNTLKDKGVTSIPDGADPVAFLNEMVTKTSGGNVEPPKLAFDPSTLGSAQGLISLYATYMNNQIDRQSKMDDLMKQMSEITTGAYKTKVGIEGGIGTKGYVGGQLQALKEFVATQAMPIQNQIDSITSQMNIDKESFTTAVALAQQLDKMNQPEIISNSNGIFSISPDGTISTLKEFPQTSGGANTPTSYDEWVLAGSPGTYAQWLKDSNIKAPTTAQQTVASYAARMEQSLPTFASLENDITKMNYASFLAQTILPSAAQSNTMQQYMQASRNFINANLRRESGAVISPTEFTEARAQYLPQPGDTADALKLKKANRDLVYNSLKNAAGSAYQSVDELLGSQMPPSTASSDMGSMLQSMNIPPQTTNTPTPTPTTGGFFSNLWSGLTSSFK